MSLRKLLLVALLVAVARAEDSPLARAKKGEWVLEKYVVTYPGGQTTFHNYAWIEKVDGKKVTLKRQPVKEDGKTGLDAARDREIDLDKLASASGDKKVSEEEVEVKGKKLKCRKVERTEPADGPAKPVTITWTSSDVPLYGKVREIVKDKDGKEFSRMDLVDWGSEGGAARDVDQKK
jgi:hypothetical protein